MVEMTSVCILPTFHVKRQHSFLLILLHRLGKPNIIRHEVHTMKFYALLTLAVLASACGGSSSGTSQLAGGPGGGGGGGGGSNSFTVSFDNGVIEGVVWDGSAFVLDSQSFNIDSISAHQGDEIDILIPIDIALDVQCVRSIEFDATNFNNMTDPSIEHNDPAFDTVHFEGTATFGGPLHFTFENTNCVP